MPEKPSVNLIWAAILHDIGKVKTQKFDEQKGRTTFDGHDRKSVEAARVVLNRLRFSNDQILEILWLIENHMIIRNISEMRPSKQKQLAVPHLLNSSLKSETLPEDLLAVLWADNQSSVKPDGTVDQESFYRAQEIIKRLISESKETPLNIKEGLGIDGKLLIDRLEVTKQQQSNLSDLVRFLNEHYRDDPALTGEQVFEMAQKWWQENVTSL